jgi:hypothetical protein
MNFNDLLRVQDFDPKKVLIMRHRPKEVRFQRILPLLAAEHHELYNTYQQTQAAREEKMLQRAEHLASFIGHESGKALFVGLYRRGQTTSMTLDEYWKHPPHQKLREYNCRGWTDDDKRDRILWFDLKRTEFYAEWAGRLVINWTGGERSWTRWSDRNDFKIDHIKEESVFDSDMPDWDELVISWDELSVLPSKTPLMVVDTSDQLTEIRTFWVAGAITKLLGMAATKSSESGSLRIFSFRSCSVYHPTWSLPTSCSLNRSGRTACTRASSA